MPTEISRKVENNKIIITYDDHTVKVIPLEPASQNIDVDSIHNEKLNVGHVITREQ